MEFETQAQKECYEKVSAWLKELFGEQAMHHQDRPVFVVAFGSALVHIGVWPWGDREATVNVRSYVITGAEEAPDLLRFLLRENTKMLFGAFGVDEDEDILFQHTILGTTCDKQELGASIAAVLKVADEYDDRIMSRWGGRRAIDVRK